MTTALPIRAALDYYRPPDDPDSPGIIGVSGTDLRDSWIAEDMQVRITVGKVTIPARVDRLFADDKSRVTPLLELREMEPSSDQALRRLMESLSGGEAVEVEIVPIAEDEPQLFDHDIEDYELSLSDA